MARGKATKTLALIEASKQILCEIQPATVRAVCYRLFTMRLIANMSKAETNKVSVQLTWAREQGVIPWGWIVDETREPERVSVWDNPAQYFESVRHSYRRDRWIDQAATIELWSEKGTVRGTLAPVLNDYGITFRVMHGYASATAIHQAAMDSRGSLKPLKIYYIGDWDPSGLHMSEVDLPTRFEAYGGLATLPRLALVKGDTTADLPSFPADTKRGDRRYEWFVSAFGHTCWELDALNPNVLRARVERAIRREIDFAAWDRAEATEAAERESICAILRTWPTISVQAQKYFEDGHHG
jgi:hypothetical protein